MQTDVPSFLAAFPPGATLRFTEAEARALLQIPVQGNTEVGSEVRVEPSADRARRQGVRTTVDRRKKRRAALLAWARKIKFEECVAPKERSRTNLQTTQIQQTGTRDRVRKEQRKCYEVDGQRMHYWDFGESAVMIDAAFSLDDSSSWVRGDTQEQKAVKAERVPITCDDSEEVRLCGWDYERNDFIDAPESDVHPFDRHVTVRRHRGN